MKTFSLILVPLLFVNMLFSSNIDYRKKKNKDEDKEKGISVGLARAWVLYNNKDYYGALRVYRGLYEKAPNNAKLNYRMGICFEATNKKDSAIFYINKALDKDSTVNNNAYYYLGRSYQFTEKLDKAINCYYIFKSKERVFKSKEPKNSTDVNRLLRQCETAKFMMANPVKVKIKGLGPNINSEYVDASPSISADQQTLIFTSRRKENIGGEICASNEQYFDDIYISKWNVENNEWAKAENIGAPINTDGFDANLSISPDGQKIFIYKNIEGKTGSGDIYYSTYNDDGKWSKPRSVDANKDNGGFFENTVNKMSDSKFVNSSFFESSASITADGKTLYFVSERERGGLGFGDIWVSKRSGGQWQKPENIGPIINTEFDEIGVYIHPDGKTLFFSSTGHNSIGKHDIFLSTKDDKGQWSTPINLGFPINTTKDEIHFVLSTSKDKAYISSTRTEGLGLVDIYEIDMSEYFQSNKEIPENLAKQFSSEKVSIIRGSIVDGDSGKPLKAQVQITNIKSKEKIIIESQENGNYFATLPANVKYDVAVISKGYESFTFKIKSAEYKDGQTASTTKHIILNKQ